VNQAMFGGELQSDHYVIQPVSNAGAVPAIGTVCSPP
jgi:hypothetical protein